MRVLVLHNRYRNPGGEDRVVASETALLRSRGVDVMTLEANNDGNALRILGNAAWSRESYEKIRAVCRAFRPHVAHVHNFWMTLTPSAIAACATAGVPVVQTLHNFRLLCANALFLRNGQPCTDCLGKTPWRAIPRRCYKGSAGASAAVVNMIVSNRRQHTWSHVSAFITPSAHAKSLFVAGGFDPGRIFVKPNFVEDPGLAAAPPSSSRTVLYIGRLSPEKGLRTLASAWRRVTGGELVVIGAGPEREKMECPGVTFAGNQSSLAVMQALQKARALVLPSVCFETFGNAVIEAYASGRPVIASDIGALGEIVCHQRTGLKFEAGNPAQLSASLAEILNNGVLADRLGAAARSEYLSRYTPARNFDLLMQIYERVTRGAHIAA